VLAGCAAGDEGSRRDRFDFADFSAGVFEEPDYRLVQAMCPPDRARLAVRFDPTTALVILGDDDRVFASLSAEGTQIGCAEARLQDPRGRGWEQRDLAGRVERPTELECLVDGPLDVVVQPIFGPGETEVVGGGLILATPVQNRPDRILVASSYEEDAASTLHYRRGGAASQAENQLSQTQRVPRRVRLVLVAEVRVDR
jgi:hypothetical protein